MLRTGKTSVRKDVEMGDKFVMLLKENKTSCRYYSTKIRIKVNINENVHLIILQVDFVYWTANVAKFGCKRRQETTNL